jgi:di/tricarboxylate transporter
MSAAGARHLVRTVRWLPTFTFMTTDLVLVLGLLVAAIVMFALNKPRMDVVALITLSALPFTGVISMNEALAGFSDPNIVLIAALFVIGEGLVRTGVAQRLGDWLMARAGSSATLLLVLLMFVVAALGATMSSTAVTAIFIPVALRIAKNTGSAPSQLMMPISFAALISGMITLIATAPNLVVSSELERHGVKGFHFFSFTPFGVVVLILGILYMVFARRWLPATKDGDAEKPGRPSLADWVGEYNLANREYRVRVSDASALAGQTVDELNLPGAFGAYLIGIERARKFSKKLFRPTAKTELRAGDVLFIDLLEPKGNLDAFLHHYALESLPLTGAYFNDRAQEIGMAEIMVPADSDLTGKTVVEAQFRSRFRLTVIGLRHGRHPLAGPIATEKLRIGDTLLVIGGWKEIGKLQAGSKDLAVVKLPIELDEVLPAPGKALQAVFCLLLVVGLMVSGVVANVHAALLGCLLMGILGCVDLTSAYNSISWKTLVLIVGMLPFSTALKRTGGVEMAADGLMSVIGGAGPHAVLACLFAITAILGMFISNTATAVLMAPIALAIAGDLHASPYPFAMTVALAASTAFMTPVSSPVNTLVVGPGNYTFGDFVRVGTPFSLIVLIVSVFMVPWLLPL